MAQPYDYTISVPNPMQGFMQGVQTMTQLQAIGEARRERERLAAEAESKRVAQEQMQQELAALAENPTTHGINRMMIKYPSMSEGFKRAYDALAPEEQKATINAAMPIYAAMENGNAEEAKRLLDLQVEAYKNSGKETESKALEAISKTISIDPRAAKVSLGGFLAAAQGPDKFAENFGKIREMPADISTKEAEARIKQREANGIPAPKFVETREGVMQWDPEKGKLVPTGLYPFSQPQVQVSLGEGQRGFDNETTLRKEYNAESKPFNEAVQAYSRLKSAASDNTGASDIAMIYAYMKMLDPGSVVREGEFATAENAGGVGAKVRNLYNKVLQGNRLTPEVKKEYLSVAGKIFTESNVKFNKLKKRYKGIAERAGLNPENVIVAVDEEPGSAGYGSAQDILAIIRGQ